MENIDFRLCFNRENAEAICKEHNTTIKDVVLNNINDIIVALQNISNKIENNERAVNEDWVKAALPMSNMMNALGNAWYLDNND